MNPAMPAHMTTTVRVAVAQVGSALFDNAATLTRISALATQAAAEDAQLVVFPETLLGGYPKGFDFGVVLGSRSDAGRELFRRYAEAAIAIPGPEVDALATIAREQRLHMVVGVVERDGGTLYCSVLYFDSTGALVGRRRKLQPTALERVLWGVGDARDIVAWDSPWGPLAGVICWENYLPRLRAAMYDRRVALYCVPTVDDRDTWLATLRHIAIEGRCFVLSANQYLTRADLPDDVAAIPPRGAYSDRPTEVAADTLIRGGSAIVDPFGNVLAGPLFHTQGLLTADFDLRDILRGKFDLDVAGHYGRPDLFPPA